MQLWKRLRHERRAGLGDRAQVTIPAGVGPGMCITCGRNTRFTPRRARSSTAPCAICTGKQKPAFDLSSPCGSTPDRTVSIPKPEKKVDRSGWSECVSSAFGMPMRTPAFAGTPASRPKSTFVLSSTKSRAAAARDFRFHTFSYRLHRPPNGNTRPPTLKRSMPQYSLQAWHVNWPTRSSSSPASACRFPGVSDGPFDRFNASSATPKAPSSSGIGRDHYLACQPDERRHGRARCSKPLHPAKTPFVRRNAAP